MKELNRVYRVLYDQTVTDGGEKWTTPAVVNVHGYVPSRVVAAAAGIEAVSVWVFTLDAAAAAAATILDGGMARSLLLRAHGNRGGAVDVEHLQSGSSTSTPLSTPLRSFVYL